MGNNINTIFVATENLKTCKKQLMFEDDRFHFVFFSLKTKKKPTEQISQISKDNSLLIIDWNSYEPNQRESYQKYFKENFDALLPYFLFMTEGVPTAEVEREFYLLDAFHFPKPTEDEHYNLYFTYFVKSLFTKIHYLSRINGYIIDSFQTIINAQIIEEQRNEILLLNAELKKLSKTDYLTNLLNRRAFFEALESERKRNLRDQWRIKHSVSELNENIDIDSDVTGKHKPLGDVKEHIGIFSCVIIDVDHFKSVNDTYGHLKGDEVLRELGKLLNSETIFRQNDIIARYGGEEFVVLLPSTNVQHARKPAERLRKLVKQIEFVSEDGEPFSVSISLGISESKLSDNSNIDIINRADQALYYAKENGRNRVVVYEDIYPSEEAPEKPDNQTAVNEQSSTISTNEDSTT